MSYINQPEKSLIHCQKAKTKTKTKQTKKKKASEQQKNKRSQNERYQPTLFTHPPSLDPPLIWRAFTYVIIFHDVSKG